MHYAIDFESEYSDSINVRALGPHNYAWATNIFLVGIYGPDIQYVGSLEEAPWPSGHHWVSHNASFDETMFWVAKQKGQIRHGVAPFKWSCTADLSAYCLLGRKLSDAAKYGLGVTHSKSIRNRAGNRKWPKDFKPKYQEDFRTYCLLDAKLCWELWEKYSPQWPAEEQEFARLIRQRCREGVCLDPDKLKTYLEKLRELCARAAAQLPWGAPYLALAQVRSYCRTVGVEPPSSLAEDSPHAEAWEATYGDRFPLIGQIRAYRKANILLRKVEAMERRLMPSGRMNFSLKYHGAGATGRLSGADGLNVQNLNREPYEGIDLRRLLVADEGMKFLIADFAQIEPRVVAWLGGNQKLLVRLGQGISFYEEDARASGAWNGEEGTFKKSDLSKYQAQKAQSLGIGYGMGAARFCKAAKDQLNVTILPAEAKLIIAAWHARNPEVRARWNELERNLALSLAEKNAYVINLPSGRSLTYMDIGVKQDGLGGSKYTAKNSFASSWQFYWGGSLFENVVQAIARDLLRDATLAVERAGIAVRFTAHDEIVAEVPLSFEKEILRGLMCQAPMWAKGLPLDVEIVETHEYLK